jgi:hypothetical protein
MPKRDSAIYWANAKPEKEPERAVGRQRSLHGSESAGGDGELESGVGEPGAGNE